MRKIVKLSEDTRPAWDAYLRRAEHGLPHQLSGWQDVLSKANRYETHYLMAYENERVVGVLPLFFLRSRLVGNTATTTPGGLCADDEQVASDLLAHGRRLAAAANMVRLVIHDSRQAWPGELETEGSHVHWVVDLPPSTDLAWQGLDRNLRRQVRMAKRNGLTLEIDRTSQSLDVLYDVLGRFAHRAGTPVFGRRFLACVIEALPGNFSIAVVRQDEEPAGAYFQLEMGDCVHGLWGATLPAFLPARAGYLAYWGLLENAVARGYSRLDMGRSLERSNASRFKRQWGGTCRPVFQQVVSLRERASGNGIAQLVQTDSRMRLVRRVWPKLPLSLALFLGPKLRHHVPFA